jgi:hypothetical protein
MTTMNIQALLLIAAAGSQTASPLTVTQDAVQIRLQPRTPNQMASFYEARGFPKAMIDVLKQQCFITVRVHNTSKDILWLELANWRFTNNSKALERDHRDIWKQRWHDMDMPMRSQSTFRWTLIPESLDFLPDETEGGNIVLPRLEGQITLDASFVTGADKQGPVVNMHIDGLYCAKDPA